MDEIEVVRQAKAYCSDRGLNDPVRAFQMHRSNAERRDIAFKMTFAEWWGLWRDHFHMRGNTSPTHLHMCRTDDRGGYWLGNVRIDTKQANKQEARFTKRRNHARLKSCEAVAIGSRCDSVFGMRPDELLEMQQEGELEDL